MPKWSVAEPKVLLKPRLKRPRVEAEAEVRAEAESAVETETEVTTSRSRDLSDHVLKLRPK